MSEISETPRPTLECTVDESWSGSTAVLSVAGTVDMLTAPTMETAIAAMLDRQPAALVVDLTAVEFFASHGMRVLVDTHNRIENAIPFGVVADGPVTARPLMLVGLTDVFPMYPTLAKALLGSAA
jgi:anti-sigma B factor antagonist